MGRPPLKRDFRTVMMMVRVSEDVQARMKASLNEGESSSDFVREAIETLTDRRERLAKRKASKPPQ